jgi:hypothetical protein
MHAGFSFSYSPISLLLRQPLSIKKSYAGAIQRPSFKLSVLLVLTIYQPLFSPYLSDLVSFTCRTCIHSSHVHPFFFLFLLRYSLFLLFILISPPSSQILFLAQSIHAAPFSFPSMSLLITKMLASPKLGTIKCEIY